MAKYQTHLYKTNTQTHTLQLILAGLWWLKTILIL